jgi:hypothetical protein
LLSFLSCFENFHADQFFFFPQLFTRITIFTVHHHEQRLFFLGSTPQTIQQHQGGRVLPTLSGTKGHKAPAAALAPMSTLQFPRMPWLSCKGTIGVHASLCK